VRSFNRVAAILGMSLASVAALPGTAQAATTAALWHMESPSALTDSSGHNNNGTTTAITSVAGSAGKGYHFNGSTSVAKVPDSSSLDPGTAALRVTVRVRFTVVPNAKVGDYDLIRKGLSGTAGGDWKMEINPPTSGSSMGTAYCYFQDAKGKGAAIRNGRNLADGVWHTITCVKTSTSIQVIVDGAARSNAVSLGSISNSQPVYIGQKPGADKYLGDMDEVSIQVG
jgi:hypothetical protein